VSQNLKILLVIGFALALVAFAFVALKDKEQPRPSTVRVVPASEIEWGSLNPLRGDKSPRAGTLWGSRTGPVPSGFLVKFVDGFSSPPHIHPVTYRGVVISGEVHNDDPQAEETWLPAGSFWTQPAGDIHITAARGNANVAYIEIEKGPYLVRPSKEAFEGGEEPVWMKASGMPWAEPSGAGASAAGPKVAALPGNPQDDRLRRTLLKLPSGFDGSVRSHGSIFHAVVVQGRPKHEVSGKTDGESLEPGSYFGSEGEVVHQLTCEGQDDCLIYVRTEGEFDVVSAQPK
jgi:quercetin dioxygenase-like cupin family protein